MKSLWFREDAKHRNEKCQVSPKFERINKAVENIYVDIGAELVEECLNKFVNEDIAMHINKNRNQVSSSSPMVRVWVADPSLPEGWKTCVISKGEQLRYGGSTTPEKRMFYSPCGELFGSRLSLGQVLYMFFKGKSDVVGRQKK